MASYAIYGYGLYMAVKHGIALTVISAKSPQAARKTFLREWEGHYAAKPESIRAVRVLASPSPA